MSSFFGLANFGASRPNVRACWFCRLPTRMMVVVILAFASAAVPAARAANLPTDPAKSGSLAPRAANPAAEKTFHSDELGFEFSYPGDREVVVGCHSSKNCVAVVGKSAPPGDYIVAFEIFDGPLDVVAASDAVFEKQGEGWIAKGRNGTSPVERLAGEGWQGLMAIVDCGVSNNSDFHPGAGECLWVAASDGRRSIVADTQGTAPIGEDVMGSILSLKFSRP